MKLGKPLKNGTRARRRKCWLEKRLFAFARSTAHSVCKFFVRCYPQTVYFFQNVVCLSSPATGFSVCRCSGSDL